MENQSRIIAVDFDGTLVENAFPEIGAVKLNVWQKMLEARAEGHQIILWTCRNREHLTAAVEFCRNLGFEFDAINENLPHIIEAFQGDTRKVFAHEYWDDKVPDYNWGMIHAL